jgi:hypothetical protein
VNPDPLLCRVKPEDQTIFANPETIETVKLTFEIPDIFLSEGILERREGVRTVKYSLANGVFELSEGFSSRP